MAFLQPPSRRDARLRPLTAAVCAVSLYPSVASAQEAGFQYPLDVAVAKGAVYVADNRLPGIWKIEADKPAVLFQAEKKFRTPLNAVRCLAVDHQGQLLAGDTAMRDVYRFDNSGKPLPLTGGGIQVPMGIAVASDGTIFVADRDLELIWKVAAEGGKPEKFAEVFSPEGMTFDAEGWLWVVSHGPQPLVKVSPEGMVVPVVKDRPFRYPHDVVLDKTGRAYVSDGYAKAVWQVTPDGKAEKWIEGEPLQHPVGLAWRGEKLLIADSRARKVFEVDADGAVQPLKIPPADR